MAQAAKTALPSSTLGIGALLVGGIVAGLFMPKAASLGQKAVRRATGFTYRDQKTGGPAPSVDPAAGRAA